MIRYTDTTVFNVDVQTIVNTINCVGVMGSGLALEFKLRFPEMYEDYAQRCKRKEVKVGRPYLYRGYENPLILNFPTKNHWKYPSKVSWVEKGLQYFIENYEKGSIQSVAFPKLGTSRGGLDWQVVKPLMEKYLDRIDLEIYICLDEERKATGIEGKMVSMVNDLSNRQWFSTLSIRKTIEHNILTKLPISRFYELESIKGVGKKSYETIFDYFYQKANESSVVLEKHEKSNKKNDIITGTQLSLLE